MINQSQNTLFSDPINVEKITKSTEMKGTVSHFDSIDSTSTWLQNNGDCGDVCISDMQTSGRGSRGNQWLSPQTGNIYFSLCWCFDVSLQTLKHQSLLGLVAGIAIAEALKDLGLKDHGIKWPNDIFWQQQKMGGILIESVNQTGKVVIGIGLNVNMPTNVAEKIDQQVCSLSDAFEAQHPKQQLASKCVSRNQFIIYMIQHLNKQLIDFSNLSFESFLESWNSWDILKDKAVSFTHQSEEVSGRVSGLDAHGRLGILNDLGQIKYYSSADIKLRKPS